MREGGNKWCFTKLFIIKYRLLIFHEHVSSVERCQCFHYKGDMVHYQPIISGILLKAANGNCFCY